MLLETLSLRKQKTVLYEDCSDTTLEVYINIMKDKDLKHLVKSGKMPSQEVLIAKMEKINEEFMELRGENSTLTNFDKIQYREQLILKVNFCFQLVDRIAQRTSQGLLTKETIEGFVEELKRWGYRINRDKPLIDELEKITSDLKALQTTIDILGEEIYPEVEKDTTEEEKKVLAFYSMLLSFQRILNIDKINIKTTSLLEFVAIENQVKKELERKKSE
jgi:hypothetical protein